MKKLQKYSRWELSVTLQTMNKINPIKHVVVYFIKNMMVGLRVQVEGFKYLRRITTKMYKSYKVQSARKVIKELSPMSYVDKSISLKTKTNTRKQ